MDMNDLQHIDAQSGAAVGILGAIVFSAVKVWRALSSEKVETSKDRAESLLYDSLKDQINELRHAMDENKTAAAGERFELAERMKTVESELKILSYKYRDAQSKALESYVSLKQGCPHCDTSKIVQEVLETVFKNT